MLGKLNIKLDKPIRRAVALLELVLAAVVVAGTAWYLFVSIGFLFADSTSPTFFFTFIEILLSAIIGIEVARVLVTHNLCGIIEILGFVMARKVLVPDATAVDILIVVVAFGVLVYVRKMLLAQNSSSSK